MQLFQKAKRLGTWDPQALDLSKDAADWAGFSEVERDFLLRTLVLFQAGEEGVTSDLLPLIMAVAAEGRLEEEIYLTSFLDRKSTRLNSSHLVISYAVFCLKKKNKHILISNIIYGRKMYDTSLMELQHDAREMELLL